MDGEKLNVNSPEQQEAASLNEVLAAGIVVIDMFDQANTNNAIIENLGSRGQVLLEAISDLRDTINRGGQKTILNRDQVGPVRK